MSMEEPSNKIAVIGMACRLPGAEDLNEFWDLLQSGRSMWSEEPAGRFPSKDHWRHQGNKSIYSGNFISDVDAFDHKFFKKSSREAASMDPQQRWLLQVAYQALESAGLLTSHRSNPDVGCYIGSCSSDYNDNVACHPPNAFSSLGTLRAFMSGNLSHYFGWTGPSVTFDTACSSSSVAIDAACDALNLKKCRVAVAGGASLYTNPLFFQNLSTASFLSPTGPTKAFDANADGYCRGEGVGLVVLKRLCDAIKDNDIIHGVILASAVSQSGNNVPITVPYGPSLAQLYRKVISMARIPLGEVTYIEAHGSGTKVGDPNEFQAIQDVFGSELREEPLYLASAKGNVGHTEAASGVVGLIKIILMMHNRAIPRQACFQTANPKLDLSTGKVAIPVSTIPWNAAKLTAVVNNYGASGSLSAIVVSEPPSVSCPSQRFEYVRKFPFLISAGSETSLRNYISQLRAYIQKSSTQSIGDIAFALAYRQHRQLVYSQHILASSMSQLDERLGALENSPYISHRDANSGRQRTVLVFGGQTSRCIGISEKALSGFPRLKAHLKECDYILAKRGITNLYQTLYNKSPCTDIIALHTAQFAIQYASAMAWIDCGLQVDCLLGHSFGQLVALAVSGALSLTDGIDLIHARAQLIQTKWSSEKGAMIAIEAEESVVKALIGATQPGQNLNTLEIACHNGPTSFVVVGSHAAVNALASDLEQTQSLRFKRLDVTHGFHSIFTEPILPELQQFCQNLSIGGPRIPIETCSQGGSWTTIDPKLLAEQTRLPVYFSDATERIASRLGQCAWIEAGSGSSITRMVRRVLHGHEGGHSFYPADLSRDDAVDFLADTTIQLWKDHHDVQFWPFQDYQSNRPGPMYLPPYQFEKYKHWLDFVDRSETHGNRPKPEQIPHQPSSRSLLLPISMDTQSLHVQARFKVDTHHEDWIRIVEGHSLLGRPLCPASMYVELATRALRYVYPRSPAAALSELKFNSLEFLAPLGLMKDSRVEVIIKGTAKSAWQFAIRSAASNDEPGLHQMPTHAKGDVFDLSSLHAVSTPMHTEEQVAYRDVEKLLQRIDCESIAGKLVYKTFGRVIQYSPSYMGISRIVSKDGMVAASVRLPDPVMPWSHDSIWDTFALDNFLQVAGLYLNCLEYHDSSSDSSVHVCHRLSSMYLNDRILAQEKSNTWTIFANSTRKTVKESHTDIYVFDAVSKALVMSISGVYFTKVSMISLQRALGQSSGPTASLKVVPRQAANTPQILTPRSIDVPQVASRGSDTVERPPQSLSGETVVPNNGDRDTIATILRGILSETTDVPAADFQDLVTFDDLGIDSLMMTEIKADISAAFSLNISQKDMEDIIHFRSMLQYLTTKLVGSPRSLVSPNFTPPEDPADHLIQGVKENSCLPVYSMSDTIRKTDNASPKIERGDLTIGTAVYKETEEGLRLSADIYLPTSRLVNAIQRKWPVAILIHGGGHVLLSKKEIRPKQIKHLLRNGVLPISIDYRLCPEKNLREGPIEDVKDAFVWARTRLQHCFKQFQTTLHIDCNRIGIVGWSTGGMLALSTCWTSRLLQGVSPPEAVISFYSPTDYADPFWKQPNFPSQTKALSETSNIDPLQSVVHRPISAYNVPSGKSTNGNWLSLSDARSQLVLHMNWNGQTLPVLCHGLPPSSSVALEDRASYANLPQPYEAQIEEISPLAQIKKGNVITPVYLLHGDQDDLVPWQQSQRTCEELRKRGVDASVNVLAGEPHLFDLESDASGKKWNAVVKAYDYLFEHLGVREGQI